MRSMLACLLVVPSLVFASQVPLTGAVQMSQRGGHGCVVTNSGGAKCWGANGSGQLGNGPATSFRSSATDVLGLTTGVIAIEAAPGAHSCAIVSGGGVKCWGANNSGQLGDGTTTDRLTPVDVQGLPWAAVELTAGSAHTCARSAAGDVACWGLNGDGQLGDGTTTMRLNPVVVGGLGGAASRIKAGNLETCAVMAPTGTAKCWGTSGALQGQATPIDQPSFGTGITAIDIAAQPNGFVPPTGPEPVFNARSCTIASGTTICSGSAVAGAPMGSQDVTVGFEGIATGVLNGHNDNSWTCVVTSAGAARCWGGNFCGALGDGAPPDCNFDAAIPQVAPGAATDVVGLSSGVVSVSAGSSRTCALLTSGAVTCWGDGTSAPVAIQDGTTPQTISVFNSFGNPGVGGTVTLTVVPGGSTSPVILTSLTPATCSVTGVTVTGIAGGTCTIAANQAGDAFFDAAPQATVDLAVDPRHVQTITLTAPASVPVGGVGSVDATSDSGLPVTITLSSSVGCSLSGKVVTGTAMASCEVLASQAGDATHLPATAQADIDVTANAGVTGVIARQTGAGTGRVTSQPAGIDCGSACAANFTTGTTVTLTAAPAPGTVFRGWQGACTGTGDCVLSMDSLKTARPFFDSDTPRLANLSTRANVGTGVGVMIAGFIVGGSVPKTVVVSVSGPSLTAFGIANPLGNPQITLVRSSDGVVIATNDDWNVQSVAPDRDDIVASGLQPSNGFESALIKTLAPGAYTAIVTGVGIPTGTVTGTALVGVFEVDNADTPLINLSTRGQVLTANDVMIAGFIVQGAAPQRVVVNVAGPSLAAFGVTGALPNPALKLVRSSDGAVLATNDDWQVQANPADVGAITAAGLQPSDPRESAIIADLAPGAYTVIVTGVGGTTGIGLVGVFAAP